jgi:hypothetical protein
VPGFTLFCCHSGLQADSSHGDTADRYSFGRCHGTGVGSGGNAAERACWDQSADTSMTSTRVISFRLYTFSKLFKAIATVCCKEAE